MNLLRTLLGIITLVGIVSCHPRARNWWQQDLSFELQKDEVIDSAQRTIVSGVLVYNCAVPAGAAYRRVGLYTVVGQKLLATSMADQHGKFSLRSSFIEDRELKLELVVDDLHYPLPNAPDLTYRANLLLSCPESPPHKVPPIIF